MTCATVRLCACDIPSPLLWYLTGVLRQTQQTKECDTLPSPLTVLAPRYSTSAIPPPCQSKRWCRWGQQRRAAAMAAAAVEGSLMSSSTCPAYADKVARTDLSVSSTGLPCVCVCGRRFFLRLLGSGAHAHGCGIERKTTIDPLSLALPPPPPPSVPRRRLHLFSGTSTAHRPS